MHNTPKLDRESAEDHDIRTWRNHCTTNDKGEVEIPNMAFKQSIDTAAFKLGIKVPGRRTTFKSFFASGFICESNVPLMNGAGLWKPEDAVLVIISANPEGKRGGGKRVPRRYPVFNKWHGIAYFTILDDIITQDIFELHVKVAGTLVGIGRFRPEVGGINGRFRPTKFEWEDIRID